jgi:hypothetical protein
MNISREGRASSGSNRRKIYVQSTIVDEDFNYVQFLICGKCFWCASLIEARIEKEVRIASYSRSGKLRCQGCGDKEVIAIPVSLG